jgi:hypothetical protein
MHPQFLHSEDEIESLKLIKEIVDHRLFNRMVKNIKEAIAFTMLETEKEEDRDRLYSEAKAIDRLVSELTKMANTYRSYSMEKTNA